MSYDSKIAVARDAIEQHNSTVDTPVDFDKFLEELRDMGGSSDEALKAVSWEDLQDCGLPRIMARRISFNFRQDSKDEGGSSAYVSSKKVHSLSRKELVERYDPQDSKSPVGKRLKDISDGKPFIVFADDGKVLIEPSVGLLEDIANGLPPVETAFVEGVPMPVYKIGDRPDAYVDENPIYPGRPLRSQEMCDQTGRSWSGIAVDVRQLLSLAVKTKELQVATVADAGDVMDKVMSQDCNLKSLRSRYPQASKKYDELTNTGMLPRLKIKLGGYSGGNKDNNPFGASASRIY